jgi:cytochrome c
MSRIRTLIVLCVLAAGGLLSMFDSALAQSTIPTASLTPQATPTFDVNRLAQPPTVYPPMQADNGGQIYWGMCMSCHGDHGQGLTEEWRESYAVEERDCWQSGCHGSDVPENSFSIAESGVPSLWGGGRLSRFENSHELYTYIQQNMPYFRTGSLSPRMPGR